MPYRRPLTQRIAQVDAELQELRAALASGRAAPGARGRIRYLEGRKAWYEAHYDRLTAYQAKTYSLGRQRKLKPVDVPADLSLDVAALL